MVLLVDDDPDFSALLEVLFRQHGHDVQVAYNLAQATASVTRDAPDVIVLDGLLPDGPGLGWLDEMRASGKIRVPVVFVSGAYPRHLSGPLLAQLGVRAAFEKGSVSYPALARTVAALAPSSTSAA